MTRELREFTAEHKQQVVRMVMDDGLKVADVCRDQNLGETAVRRWVVSAYRLCDRQRRPGLLPIGRGCPVSVHFTELPMTLI